jgi:hypothetical protein
MKMNEAPPTSLLSRQFAIPFSFSPMRHLFKNPALPNKGSITMLSLSVLALGLAFPVHADQWTSTDGKVIEADFVRMEDDFVVLRMKDKEYRILALKLNEASIKKARDLNAVIEKQAEEIAGLPIMEEEALAKVLPHSPKSFDGKQFILRGKVGSISLPDGTPLMAATRGKGEGVIAPGHKVQVTFTGGSKAVFDFSNKVAAHISPTFKRNARLEVTGEKAALMTLDRFMNNNSTWQPKEDLITPGQVMAVHAHVQAGTLVCGREATPQDIGKAEMEMRQLRK